MDSNHRRELCRLPPNVALVDSPGLEPGSVALREQRSFAALEDKPRAPKHRILRAESFSFDRCISNPVVHDAGFESG